MLGTCKRISYFPGVLYVPKYLWYQYGTGTRSVRRLNDQMAVLAQHDAFYDSLCRSRVLELRRGSADILSATYVRILDQVPKYYPPGTHLAW
jgi:hypothetical protein